MFIVGIDIAKRSHAVSVITSERQIVCKSFTSRSRCSDYNALLLLSSNLIPRNS